MIQEGDTAPSFILPSTAGAEVSLEDAVERGPAVLLFFRGHWCSFCAEQLQTFSALGYDLWRHLDVDVLPISGEPVPKLVEMRDRFDLRLQLLADPDLAVVPDYAATEDHRRFGEIPVAATVVVDDELTVRYAHHAEDPADRTYANYVRSFIRGGFEPPGPR